jgi:hypothetical protein
MYPHVNHGLICNNIVKHVVKLNTIIKNVYLNDLDY